MHIQQNIPLAPLTTFQVGGPARYFCDASTESEVEDAVTYAGEKGLPLFVLGGGSNVLVADAGWPGLVLRISIAGVKVTNQGPSALVRAGAGENWDQLVALAVGKNCSGLECLSGIPGTVGGTPVQNVGAYGQEVSQAIVAVRALEILTGKVVELDNPACGFAYRASVFNSTQRGRYIVLQVTYQLQRDGPATLAYADLKTFFAEMTSVPGLQQVREAVRNIRLSKAMLLLSDGEDSRSAGSFFKNPMVPANEADRIQGLAQRLAPSKTLPRFPASDGKNTVKLSAAWLVEQVGFEKGYSRGPVGISRKHALAIVNRGGATAHDILAFQQEVSRKVSDIWGVTLEPEPVFVGF